MSKELQDFDKKIRQHYSNSGIEPPSYLWNKIIRRLDINGILDINSQDSFLYAKLGIAASILVIALVYISTLIQPNKPHPINQNQVENSENIGNKNSIANRGTLNYLPKEDSTEEEANNLNTDLHPNINSIASNPDSVMNSEMVILSNRLDFASNNKISQSNSSISSTLQSDPPSLTESNKNMPGVQGVTYSLLGLQDLETSNPDLNMHLAYDSTIQTKDLTANNNKFFIELNLAPEYSYRYVYNNPEHLIPKYDKSYFNQRETGTFNLSGGIAFGYKINNSWGMKTGIKIYWLSQHLKTEMFNVATDPKTQDLVYSSSGIMPITVYSSDTISSTTILNSSIKFTYLEIPVMVEYKLNKYLFLNTGLGFNILVNQNINWQAEDFNGQSEIIGKEVLGLSNFSLRFLIAIGFDYPLNENISLVANPTMSVFITNLNNSYTVKSYPYSIGLKMGIRLNI